MSEGLRGDDAGILPPIAEVLRRYRISPLACPRIAGVERGRPPDGGRHVIGSWACHQSRVVSVVDYKTLDNNEVMEYNGTEREDGTK